MPENSIEKLKQLKILQSTFVEDVCSAERKVDTVEEEIQKLVGTTIQAMFPDTELGVVYPSEGWGWACESPDVNPFPLCVYNELEDPCLDDCLFCHQPNERK